MKRRIESIRLRSERPRGRRRRAFTLVELLVVIAIIGMLMALLIPAVQMARESARRATCMNNQKQIGTAIMNFATERQRMPSGFSAHPSTLANDNTGNGCMGWVVPLLPMLEQKPIYDKIQTTFDAVRDPGTYGISPQLSVLICPSRSTTDTIAPNSYVVNAGMTDNYNNTSPNPLDYQANGVFFDHYSTDFPTAGASPRITTDLSYISDHDGTSSTVLFSENVDAADWIGPVATVQLPMKNSPTDMGQTWGQGIVWRIDSATPNLPFFLNRNIDTLRQQTNNPGLLKDDSTSAKPSSAHPGGYLLTMVDGHTIFVSEDIDYRVYAMAISPWSSQTENKDPATNSAVVYPPAWIVGGALAPVTEADLTK